MIHSSINKIIVSGCSFTNWRRQTTWADHVQSNFNQYEFINLGAPGNSNERILPGVLNEVQSISDPCVVIIQLTGLDRVVRNGKLSPTIGSVLKSLSMNWFGMSQNEMADTSWINYFQNEYSEENHLNSLLSSIVNFQKSMQDKPNICYKFITGWDIFTQKGDSYMWEDCTPYANITNKDIKDKYESSRTLFEQIDLSKFWFFENEFIKYGGITQWCQYNLDKSLWYNNVSTKDYHPSNHAHSEFAKQIMIPLIEEILHE